MCVVTSRGDNEEVVCVEGQETQEISACVRVCGRVYGQAADLKTGQKQVAKSRDLSPAGPQPRA